MRTSLQRTAAPSARPPLPAGSGSLPSRTCVLDGAEGGNLCYGEHVAFPDSRRDWASAAVLVAAIVVASVVLMTFVFTTLIYEPASLVALLIILVLSVALDFGWKRVRANRAQPVQPGR